MNPTATGDEPHYLAVAQSIAYDQDVDLTNDYTNRERTLRISSAFPLPRWGHVADHTGSGQLRPTHGVGLSLLLAPAFRLGGVDAARIFMVLVASLLAYHLYRLLSQIGFTQRDRTLGWLAVVACLPVLAFSNQFYPELVAALLVVLVLRVVMSSAHTSSGLAVAATAGATLVWLHVRYLPLAIALLLGLLYTACRTMKRADVSGAPTRTPWLRRVHTVMVGHVSCLRLRWRTVTLPLLVPYVVALTLLAVCFQRWYGSPSLAAPYAPFWENRLGSAGWKFWYEYGVAEVFNPVSGWIPYAPVHWLGLAALGCLVVRFRWAAVYGILAVVGYALAVASVGVGTGWTFPGRFLLVIIPLIALPIAVALEQVRVAFWLFTPLFVISLAIAAGGVRNDDFLYPMSETPRGFGIRSIASAFPSPRLQFRSSFVVPPGLFAPQTGEVRDGSVLASAPGDEPGYLLWGPYVTLTGGTYRAKFAVQGASDDNEPVLTLDVLGSPPDTILAQRLVPSNQLASRTRELTLDFETSGNHLIQTRVYFHGRGSVRVGQAEITPGPLTVLPAEFRDWPLVFVWVGGTVLVGWLFRDVMRLRASSLSGSGFRQAGPRRPA